MIPSSVVQICKFASEHPAQSGELANHHTSGFGLPCRQYRALPPDLGISALAITTESGTLCRGLPQWLPVAAQPFGIGPRPSGSAGGNGTPAAAIVARAVPLGWD
jgi:hypothetical protein